MNGSVASTGPTTAVTVHAQGIGGAQRVVMVDAYRGAPIASLDADVALHLAAELVLCAQRARRDSDLDRVLDSYETGHREALEDCAVLVAAVRAGKHDLAWLEQRLAEMGYEPEDDPR